MTALCLGTDDLGDGGLRPPWEKEINLKPGEPRVEWKDSSVRGLSFSLVTASLLLLKDNFKTREFFN